MEPCGSMSKNFGQPQILTISGHNKFCDRSVNILVF